MARINNSLNKLDNENGYTFKRLSQEVEKYKKENAKNKLISLSIGDVSKPIPKRVAEEMKNAVRELEDINTFRGYGAFYGYDFLKEQILKNEYSNINFTNDEIYISNGAKSDTSNILEMFDEKSKVCIHDPIYPVYKDGAVISSKRIKVLKGYEKDNFIPMIPKERYDIIYICSPGNPTGIAYTRDDLNKWIEYANKNNSIILYDNVYEAFITSTDVPKTIYELKNAKKVAIEFRSFSKKASFTGVRCSYYIIPKEIKLEGQEKENLNDIWKRRVMSKFNGTDYIAQKGAWASYLPEAEQEIKSNIKEYLENAKLLRDGFSKFGFKVYGGIDAPFLWMKIPNIDNSWNFFEDLLEKANIIVTPGLIFGKAGRKYIRISALGTKEDTYEAIRRLKIYYEK